MISNKNLQNVMIKGTKEGLTLHLDDSCSVNELLKELDEKLKVSSSRIQKDDPVMKVNIHTGDRLFSKEEEEQLLSIVEKNHKLIIERINSNVVDKEEANRLIEESRMKTVSGVIRSGQVLRTDGDILVIGDVHPGAVIKAGGNVYVLGKLNGSVQAGCFGNKEAIIAAGLMTSAQISIADVHTTTVTSAPKTSLDLHTAFLNGQGEIAFDRISALKHLRPNLTRLEGGL